MPKAKAPGPDLTPKAQTIMDKMRERWRNAPPLDPVFVATEKAAWKLANEIRTRPDYNYSAALLEGAGVSIHDPNTIVLHVKEFPYFLSFLYPVYGGRPVKLVIDNKENY